ncbi:hypothetical protein JW926_16785 [Candidatus Sumerlaeota bacterium]|nr:hypothetical protein [Candidatus Sumerlaeota bacterium]
MKQWKFLSLALFISMFVMIYPGIGAQTPVELKIPTGLEVIDTPSDSGESLLLKWPKMENESIQWSYVIYRSSSPDGEFKEVEKIESSKEYGSDNPQWFGFDKENANFHVYKVSPVWEMRDLVLRSWGGKEQTTQERVEPLKTYYKIGVTDGEQTLIGKEVVSGIPKENWYRRDRFNGNIILIILFAIVITFILHAQRNPNLFLRKIPGIDAVDEAVGRATEMGKPILYSTGYYDISELSTICSVNILAHVAKKVAQYDSRLIVPCKYPVAMTVCQEVVREAYINAGRPDAFNASDIFFIAGEQFSYTIGVDSIMVREKPAANFFLGTFAAEALILAETGATTGAIQIAGTDSNYQIPFFIVACDYCLISEELYAASAYLARNPQLIGSLKGQDAGKMLLFFALIVGTLMVTIGVFFPDAEIFNIIKQFFTVR